MCIERPHKGPGDGGTYNGTADSIPAPVGAFFPGNGVNNRTVALIQLSGEGSPTVVSSSIFQDGAPLVYANSFCGGHVQMANGSILVIGGDGQQWTDASGNQFLVSGGKNRRVFTPCGPTDYACTNGTWSTYSDMVQARWYPTVVTLKDGKYLNPPPVGTWPKNLPVLTWAFPHSLYPVAVSMPSGRVFVFVSNESVVIDPAQDFSNPAAVESHPIPDLVPGNSKDPVLEAAIADHSPWIYPHSSTFTVLPMTLANNYTFRVQICGGSKSPASAVSRGAQYNISYFGDGGQPRPYASASCVQINPDDPQPVWSATDPMPNARVMPDSIILPDGKILYVNGAGWGQAGGDAGQAQYATDPVFGRPPGKQWTSLANATVPRLYHSGVVLLPSGHVITTGSEMQNYVDFWGPGGPKANCYPAAPNGVPAPSCTSPFEQRIERCTPPYLLNTSIQRPNITAFPASLTYNSTFKITVSGPVDRVTLIRYTTTTHGVNTDQRFIELPILAKNGNDLYLGSPPHGGYVPPGNQMLWALNQGVPSIAATVNLQSGPQVLVPIPAGATAGNVPGGAIPGGASGAGPVPGSHNAAPKIFGVAEALGAGAALAAAYAF
ncbi:hypothetical protein BDK51DRAFT_28156 [Blyttiomyces helicus]|uniref:Uncharacterized protein n=1 Tax=Blyttiomyces helicus TaxID=388810 RepID=A0A4V1IQQ4_9FUNG|nr:hypothetical protein BDK51DRAFT_28156 [Blyttiomyces helicus]|eukprot:RKO87367.1 hypothetical protein BDK51DRAFT_28156 [Blyttiomyces helicus]